MPIPIEKFHHVSRQTRQLDVARRFYVEVLGFRELARPPFPFPGAWLYAAGIQIHLIDEPYDAPPQPINTRENHIAFAVEDLDAAAESLTRLGIEFRRNIVPERNTNQIFFRDPDGWMIEIGRYVTPPDA